MSPLRTAAIIFALVIVPFFAALGYGVYSSHGWQGIIRLGVAVGVGIAFLAFNVAAEGLLHGLFWLILPKKKQPTVGYCSQCGYDLRGNVDPACCPECGGDVPAKLRAKQAAT
jgi:hypothetical protein